METYVGSEVLTAVVTKSSILWDVALCNPLKFNRRFGGTYHFHLQFRRISQTRNQGALLATCFHAGFFFGLFFDLEDEADMFLRNVGWLSADYTTLYPRRQKSSRAGTT
jgi:hypothetical protein